MDMLYHICISISLGTIVGFLVGSVKLFKKKEYSESRQNKAKKLLGRFAAVLKYVTFFMLVLGLIWCIYYLILGIKVPSQADYANNMAELIVAVLTVISIIFAFVEFLRRTDDK